MRRKAEEKARKALENARKAEERKQKKNTRSTSGRKQMGETSARSTCLSPEAPPSKKARLKIPTSSSSSDDNVCCMCFGTYDDDILEGAGTEWISCACGRWLHEDCCEDCITDQDGQDRLCPFCVDILSA